jgi:hypothetical protein
MSLVECGEEKRQRRLRDSRPRVRQGLREGVQTVLLEEVGDDDVQNWTVHGESPEIAFRGREWYSPVCALG